MQRRHIDQIITGLQILAKYDCDFCDLYGDNISVVKDKTTNDPLIVSDEDATILEQNDFHWDGIAWLYTTYLIGKPHLREETIRRSAEARQQYKDGTLIY